MSESFSRSFFHLAWDRAENLWVAGKAGAGTPHADTARRSIVLEQTTHRVETADGMVALMGKLSEMTLHPDGRHEQHERKPNYQAFGHERLFLRGADGRLWRNRLDRIEHDGELVLNSRCKVNTFEMDRSGAVWAATDCDGVYRLRERRISAVTQVQGRALGAVYGLAEGRDGALWMATLNNGVAVLEPSGAGRWLDKADVPRVLNPVFTERSGDIRIGRCLLLPTGHCQGSDDLPETGDLIGAFLQARDGRVWLGSNRLWQRPVGGTWHLDTSMPTFPTTGQIAGLIRTLLETADGTLWLGTVDDGIRRRTPDGQWQRFGLEHGLSGLAVRALREDRDGNVWIAMENRGLCRVKPDGDSTDIACLGRERGLWSNSLHQLIFDDDDWLWINSNHGVFAVSRASLNAVLDGQAARVHPQVFTESDGLPDREGNGGVQDAGIRLSDGRIAFPTQNGVALLDPAQLRPVARPPTARFESLTLPGETTRPVSDVQTLARGKRSAVVHYTGLSENLTAPVYFRHRMRPNDPWTDMGDARQISLDRLSPGEHRIELQAFGSDGQGGESDHLVLQVPAYLHETSGFRAAAVVAMLLAVVVLLLRQRHVARQRQAQLETTVVARTEDLRCALEENERLASSKARFFANVSHELRTPLTLLVGPLDDLARGHPPDSELADAMARNAHRLDRLIGQLLDLERIGADRFPLRPEIMDLGGLAREAMTAFQPLALAECLTLESDVPDDPVTVTGDVEQLMRVIGNLLSNALKFCPAGGRVRLSLRSNGSDTTLHVDDNGPGVPSAWRERTFDRFSQMGSAATRSREGAGLGLALCREVAQLHGGRLYATNSPLGGARFVFELPVPARSPLVVVPRLDASPQAQGRASEGDARAEINVRHGDDIGHAMPLAEAPPSDVAQDRASAHPQDKPLLLLAEDNPDLRTYLAGILAEHYRVAVAEDGDIALTLAQAEAPDLIVTDLMMPNRDGLGLASAIRAAPDLSGVPIVFLTARASDADRIAGLVGGADYYLTKPFDSQVLLAQLAAALRACQRLRARYAADSPAPPQDAQPRSPFAERFGQTIAAHFHDPALDVAGLAQRLHMSQATLRRHCQAELLAGPGDLLRQHRMEHARDLLRQRAGNVSEIAYAVGYTRLASFSRAYREHFGHPPGTT